jgi:hypothetical protein
VREVLKRVVRELLVKVGADDVGRAGEEEV